MSSIFGFASDSGYVSAIKQLKFTQPFPPNLKENQKVVQRHDKKANLHN
jgi:hypothetical protein